jgi:hypothetical protein
MAGDKTDYYWDITDYPDDGSFVITDEVVFTTHDMSGDPDWQEGVHTSPGTQPMLVYVKRRRRGRPHAIEHEETWCRYQDIAMEVQRQRRKYPDAKLDDEIVRRVARWFGVPTRRVWRAIKFQKTMSGGREPPPLSDFMIALHEECDRRMGIRRLGRWFDQEDV